MGNESDRTITLQDFVRNGEAFIPLFSDAAHFRKEAAGGGFEHKGVVIKWYLLHKMLTGNERLMLNPGSEARRLSKGDLA